LARFAHLLETESRIEKISVASPSIAYGDPEMASARV
jgi:hypothetical protein